MRGKEFRGELARDWEQAWLECVRGVADAARGVTGTLKSVAVLGRGVARINEGRGSPILAPVPN